MNILQKLIDEAVRNSATIRADELRRVQRKLEAAERTLTGMGYYWDGEEYFHPPTADRLVPMQAIVGNDDFCHGIPKEQRS